MLEIVVEGIGRPPPEPTVADVDVDVDVIVGLRVFRKFDEGD